MKILDQSGGYFDLQPGFELNIEQTNPLLTEQGSLSLPVELPNTDRNIRMTGYIHRIDRHRKAVKKRKVVIENQSFVKNATLQIISTEDTISSFFLLNESKLYTEMKEITMKQLFSKYVRDPYSGSMQEKVTQWIAYLEKVLTGEAEDDFQIFPVCTKVTNNEMERSGSGGGRQNTSSSEESKNIIIWSSYEYLNEPAITNNNDEPDKIGKDSSGNEYYKFRAGETTTRPDPDDDEVLITNPIGYGITPFLKYSVVLRKIFEYFGYELLESPFDTDPTLKKEVLLNNTADAILRGILDYSQIVPSCTVNDFLESVRIDYGCEFFLQENGKYVEVRFWNDILGSHPDIDFTKKLSSTPKRELADPKRIKLTANRSLEFTESNYKTYQELIEAFGTPQFLEYLPFTYPKGTVRPDIGFYYVASRNAFYQVVTEERYPKLVCYNTFDYYETADKDEYIEKLNPREHLPMVKVDFGSVINKYSSRSGLYAIIPFIGERRHVNTALKLTTENEDGSTETTEKADKDADCPIISCFHVGRGIVANPGTSSRPNDNEAKLFFGSTSRYRNDGKPWGDFNIAYNGDDGLYKRHWEQYDLILKKSNDLITLKEPHLNPEEIMNFRMDCLKILNGQPLLPATLRYIVKDKEIKVSEIELYTTKLYDDSVL